MDEAIFQAASNTQFIMSSAILHNTKKWNSRDAFKKFGLINAPYGGL